MVQKLTSNSSIFAENMPLLQQLLGLSIADYIPKEWEELKFSTEDFWTNLFVLSPESVQLLATVRNLRGSCGILVGQKGSGKSTLLRHLQYESFRDDLQTESVAFLIYDIQGRWANIKSVFEFRKPGIIDRLRGVPQELDTDSFVKVIETDLKKSLEFEINNYVSEETLWFKEFVTRIGADELSLPEALWEIREQLNCRLVLLFDNIDQIPFEGIMPSLIDLATSLYRFRKGGSILGIRSVLAVRHGNFGRLNVSNAYTDWVDRIHFLASDDDSCEFFNPEYRFMYDSSHIQNVIERRTKEVRKRINPEIADFIEQLNRVLYEYSNLETNIWRLANRSFRVYSEIVVNFSKYLYEEKDVRRTELEKLTAGRGHAIMRQWFIEWLYEDGYAQQYVLLSLEELGDAEECSVKRMIVGYLYNRYVRNPGGNQVARVGEIFSELRKVGYDEDAIANSLYQLYMRGSFRGRMINFVIDFLLKNPEELKTKVGQVAQVFLMPMGIVNYENVILSFEVFNRQLNLKHNDIELTDSQSVVQAFYRVVYFLKEMVEKHRVYLDHMAAEFRSSEEVFGEYFSRCYCKGGSYFVERIIDAHLEELNRYYPAAKGTGGLYYNIRIRKATFYKLQAKYDEVRRMVREKYPKLIEKTR